MNIRIEMAVRIGKDDDELPDAKDYVPPKKERKLLFKQYKRQQKTNVNPWPLIVFCILALFVIASLVAATIAGIKLYSEGYGILPITFAIIIPIAACWFWHLNGELIEGFFLSVPGAVLWGVAFAVVRTQSSLWLMIAAIATIVALLAVNTQAEITYY